MHRPGQCTVKQLKEATKDLGDDDILQVNAVGNLSILRPTAEGDYLTKWVGIIILGNANYTSLEAELDLFDEERIKRNNDI